MSDRFVLISWTPYKRHYDLVVTICLVVYLATFLLVGSLVHRGSNRISPEILLIRATATAAIVLLHAVLSIGPLARLNRKFLPLLYNRRHLGVITFFVALAHAALAIGFYHGFGRISPLRSVLTSNTQYRSISAFPFELSGFIALVILSIMAVTSHDLWLKKLTPRLWKSIHMAVYFAWFCVVLHVALGALQSERSLVYPSLLLAGSAWLMTLHVVAGYREVRKDHQSRERADWADVAGVHEIPEGAGRSVCVRGAERVAIFRHNGRLSAVTNVCAHQGGPLGEGRIIDGCITCPWHGYTYLPASGCAPPPFTEKVPTYQLRVQGGRILINVKALPPGTFVEPVASEDIHDAVTTAG